MIAIDSTFYFASDSPTTYIPFLLALSIYLLIFYILQVRRFRMETKAAKTLGIIVGCFICCWFPFFTMYLVEAFCQDCIPQLAFSISFWLGYCNSAINPFIYAAFSRDFRGAFKKIICKVICRHTQEPPRGIFMALHPRNVSLGAAALVMGGAGTAGAVGATGTANNTVGQSSSN